MLSLMDVLVQNHSSKVPRKSGLVIVGNRTILSEGSEDFFQLASDLCDRGNLVSAAEFKAGHVRLAH